MSKSRLQGGRREVMRRYRFEMRVHLKHGHLLRVKEGGLGHKKSHRKFSLGWLQSKDQPSYLAAAAALEAAADLVTNFSLIRADLPLRSRK